MARRALMALINGIADLQVSSVRSSCWIALLIFSIASVVAAQSPQRVPPQKSTTLLPLPKDAISLQPDERIWIDKERNRILLDGEVCLQSGPLELLICPWNGKLHESIIRVHSKPSTIHAGLLAVGGEPGAPVSYENNEYQAASGGVIEVIIQWKDDQGQLQEYHGQDWVRHRDRRADLQDPKDAGFIERAKKSISDKNFVDGAVESFWVPVHPAFRDRVQQESKEKKRHVIRPSATGKQLEQLMVLTDPRLLNPDAPEPKRFYRTQFSPAKRNNPQHQPFIKIAEGNDGDETRVDGRLKARWEPVFPRQKEEIAADDNNVLRPSPAGRQIEELIIRGVPLEHDWIFAGSRIVADPETNKEFYVADRSGEIVCVSNFPTALIDLPIESTAENAQLGFEAATENIPVKGTPVRVILVPHPVENEKHNEHPGE